MHAVTPESPQAFSQRLHEISARNGIPTGSTAFTLWFSQQAPEEQDAVPFQQLVQASRHLPARDQQLLLDLARALLDRPFLPHGRPPAPSA